ncbi:MAG: outer membrane beta-barrel protein [bacterium]
MKIGKKLISNLLLILVIFISPSGVYALDKAKPDIFITLKTEYNDNIFFETEPKAEFITTIIPGINTKIIAQKWLSEIDYRVKFLDYKDIKQKSVQHNLNLTGWHRFSNKLILSIQGNFIEDKEETLEEDFSVTRREYLKQTFDTTIKFISPKPPLETNIKYQYEDFNFRKKDENDSKENRILFDIYYTLTKRLKTGLVYQDKKRAYKNSSNQNIDSLGVGIKYELSPEINSELIVKLENRKVAGGDSHSFAFTTNFNRQINQKTSLNLTFGKDTNFTRSVIEPVEVKMAKIGLYRRLNRKTNFNLNFTSMKGNWEDSTREDKLQAISSGLSYQLTKKISFDLNYNATHRKSNIEESRKNNVYTFTIQQF